LRSRAAAWPADRSATPPGPCWTL